MAKTACLAWTEPRAVRNRTRTESAFERAKKELLELGESEESLKALDKRIRATVGEAADFAESSPEPELAELYTDVLVGNYS